MTPVEVIEKRTRSSKTHSLGGRKFAFEGGDVWKLFIDASDLLN